MVKTQVHENAQFLYHEDIPLSENHDLNMSDPAQSLPGTLNGTIVKSGVGTGTVYQTDAPQDLKVISWAPGVPLGKVRTFAYSSEGGGGSVVYVIENGIDGRSRVTNDQVTIPMKEMRLT